MLQNTVRVPRSASYFDDLILLLEKVEYYQKQRSLPREGMNVAANERFHLVLFAVYDRWGDDPDGDCRHFLLLDGLTIKNKNAPGAGRNFLVINGRGPHREEYKEMMMELLSGLDGVDGTTGEGLGRNSAMRRRGA